MYAEMGRFVEELTKAGVLLATGGLDPVGTHIKSAASRLSPTAPKLRPKRSGNVTAPHAARGASRQVRAGPPAGVADGRPGWRPTA
jgi:hypothetical protein